MAHEEIRNLLYNRALLWDVDAISEEKPVIEFISNLEDEINDTEIKDIEKIIEKASKLAYTESNNSQSSEQDQKHLKSVFDMLFDSKKGYYYELKPLELKKSVFPVKKRNLESNEYKAFDQLIEDLESCNNETQLYHTLEKYLWCMPSEENKNISLFDHTKITAALAICQQHQQLAKREDKEKYILINGDISGIQSFIFNIPSKRASKSLKGRSVYIELLMNVISRKILQELELKPANLMYCGGGNFFILAPSCKIKELEACRKNILDVLLKAHGGELYLALDYTRMSDDDLSKYTKNVQRVKDKTAALKMKRWSLLGLDTEYSSIFGPLDRGSPEEKVCKVCGSSESVSIYKDKEDGTGTPVCSLCASLWGLTDDIKRAQYISFEKITENKKINEYKSYKDVFRQLGWEVGFSENISGIGNSSRKEILKLNQTDFLKDNKDNLDGFFFGSYNLPVNEEGEQLIFEDLAKEGIKDKNHEDKENRGDEKLAYLKLDVDNLGAIFGGGLGTGKSITSVSYLSRMMKMFFEGYINILIEEEFKNKLYVIFSGGDDTFVAGPWKLVIDFYEQFHKAFSKYCALNDKMSFSAGIQLYNPKYPVIRAAESVEESLDEAKKLVKGNGFPPEKNNISLFGEVFHRLPYDENGETPKDDYKKIKDLKKIMVESIDKTGKRGILQKVMNSTIGFKKILEDSTRHKLDISRYWKLAYYLRDYKKTPKNGFETDYAGEIVKVYKELVIENLFGSKSEENKNQLMIIPVAVRWAELETRKNNSEGEGRR